MFNLEKAVDEWRKRMAAGGVRDGNLLDELESHLREDIEHRAREGTALQAAFEAAVKALGEAGALKQEFAKVRPRGHNGNRSFNSVFVRVCCWGSAAFVGVLGGWAVSQIEMSAGARALRVAAMLVAVLYFLKLPYLYYRLSRAGQISREVIRFISILAWPAWVYSVPAEAGPVLHLVLMGFGSIIPAIVLAVSFRLDEEMGESVLALMVPTNLDHAAQRSLEGAQMEAVRFHHDFIGTEHLLLAILREQESLVARIMKSRGVTAQSIADAIEKEIGVGHAGGNRQTLPRTPRANRALKLAAREARVMDHELIRAEHLFLGLLLEGDGVAYRVLTRLGVEADAVRLEIQKQI